MEFVEASGLNKQVSLLPTSALHVVASRPARHPTVTPGAAWNPGAGPGGAGGTLLERLA